MPNFYFRINKLRIVDNREGRMFGFAGKDSAEMKLYSFITTDGVDLPDLTLLQAASTQEQKTALVSKMVKAIVDARIFTEIQNVKDNHIATFGDTGYVLYQSKTIPENFSWSFIAIESDQDYRDLGGMIEAELKNTAQVDQFAKNLSGLLASGAPQFAAAVELTKFTVGLMARVTKRNKDDQLGVLYMSLNRSEHYPHCLRDKQDVPDLSNNMFVDYSLYGHEG